MFAAFNDLIEARIRDADSRGAFQDLPGSGRPLVLDEDPCMPEELRRTWMMLRSQASDEAARARLARRPWCIGDLVAALDGTARDTGTGADGEREPGMRLSKALRARPWDRDATRLPDSVRQVLDHRARRARLQGVDRGK